MVPESVLQKILESINQGNCCLVVGPRYRGKSKLVRRAAEELKRTGFYRIAYISMREITRADSQEFYANLYHRISAQVAENHSSSEARVYSASDFQIVILELLSNLAANVLLQIDDLELAPPNLIALLLGSIRSVFTTVASRPGPRFQAIVSGTVNLHQLALRGVSRFESISDLIVVDDMTLEEARIFTMDLLSKEGVQVSRDGLDAFLEQTSSDQVLIRLLVRHCVEQIRKRKGRDLTPDVIPGAISRILRTKPNFEVAEALSQIEADPELLSCFLEIVQKGAVAVNELPLRMPDNPNALDLCGVFHRTNQTYMLKSPLWRSILERHFSSAQCARLYAIAGYWRKAVEYYGKAIHKDKIDKKSDLFGATINGMQASEDDEQAIELLAQGVRACYPDGEIGIYLRSDSILRLVHFFPGKGDSDHSLKKEIRLEEPASPEVEALFGPDYSMIFHKKKARFLFPLRVHSGAQAMGLISYHGGFSQLDQYELREEILQMISFLHQGARAIEGRRKYSGALQDAKTHTRTLESLDHVLTSVLNHLELDEEVIFRLLMAGLTANECLGFNRAVLFLSDSGKEELVGTMGVGHLAWEDADADWKNFPHHTLDELLSALMVPDYQYTPLHSAIQSLRIPIEVSDVFGWVYKEGLSRRSKLFAGEKMADVPSSFSGAIDLAEEFAVAPLTAGARRLGLIYVDNKYTHRPIDDFQMASLTNFLTQAALVMEMARSLRGEREQSRILTRLLEVEKTVNNKITQSMQAVLDAIARSAWELMRADSTVAFSLKRTSPETPGYFEVDRTARAHTQAAPMGKPNSREGIAKWVLTNGQVHLKDVHKAPSFPDGYHPKQSEFLRAEGVRSFVGLRFGPKEQPEGILFVNWCSPHLLSENELTILEVFGTFAAAALPSARRHEQLRQDLQQRTEELQTLSNLIEASLDSRPEGELENLVQDTLQSLRDLTRAPIVRLYVVESGDRLREFRLARGKGLRTRVLTRFKNNPANRALDAGQVVTEDRLGADLNLQRRDWLSPKSRARLALPLLKGKNRLGAFYLETSEVDLLPLSEEELEIIQYLADRLAIAYYQREIYNSMRRLLDIAIKLEPGFELKDVIRDLVEGAVQAMPSLSTVTAYFVNRQSGKLQLGHAIGVHSRDRVQRYTLTPGSIVDRLLKRGGPIFAPFTEEDSDLHSPFAIREGVRSTAAMPLEVGEELVGYIFFNFRRQRYFDEISRGFLQLFAQIAALAIHRTNLQIDVMHRQSRLEAVAQITPVIARANPDITEVYRTALRETMNAIPNTDNVCIVERQASLGSRSVGQYRLVLKPPSNEFYHPHGKTAPEGYEMGRHRKQGIATRVIEHGKAEIIDDVRADPAYFPAISSTRSEMCIPIPEAQEAIVLESDQLAAFTLEDQKLVEMLAMHVAVALHNERQFRTQRERQTRERVAQMATGIIHDVSNIVSNIPDVVEELRRELKGGRKEELIEEYLHDLQYSADSTHRISNRLREYVMEAQFKPVSTQLGLLVKKVINELMTSKPEHVQVKYFHRGNLPKIKVDPLWVEQLFSNLLHNAFEAIPPGRDGQVLVAVWRDRRNICVAVQDNGSGIPTGLLEKIFQPGFTTKQRPGNLHGIGLSYCKQVVDVHGGNISVQSIADSETTFFVTFPTEFPFEEDHLVG